MCVAGCKLQIHRLSGSHVPLPSSLPKSPFSHRCEAHCGAPRHPASSRVCASVMAACGWAVKGSHGVAWAISFPQCSTETALFLSALCLPQTGFNWFWSPNIKPCAAVRPQKHTGRSSVPTSQESLEYFSPNYIILLYICLVKQEHTKIDGDTVKGDSLVFALSLVFGWAQILYLDKKQNKKTTKRKPKRKHRTTAIKMMINQNAVICGKILKRNINGDQNDDW